MKLHTLQAILLAALPFGAQQAFAQIDTYQTPYKIVGKQSGLCLTAYPASGLPAPIGNGLKFKLQPCANDTDSRTMQTFYIFQKENGKTSLLPQLLATEQMVRIYSAKELELTGQWSALHAERAWAAPLYMGGNLQRPPPQGLWQVGRAWPPHVYNAFDVTIKHYPTGYCMSPAHHHTAAGTDVGIGMCAIPEDVWKLVPTNYATSPVF